MRFVKENLEANYYWLFYYCLFLLFNKIMCIDWWTKLTLAKLTNGSIYIPLTRIQCDSLLWYFVMWIFSEMVL
jgi:hypothetical protein